MKRTFILLLALLFSACTTMKPSVTVENVSTYRTSELCVYAYSYQNLPNWTYMEEEWIVIDAELKSRGYSSRDDCNSFTYAMNECNKRNLLDKEAKAACVSQFGLAYENEVKQLFETYANREKESLARKRESDARAFESARKIQEINTPSAPVFCSSTTGGPVVHTYCY